MDQHYERMRARLLAAIAEHEQGDLDDAGLQAALADLVGALGGTHAEVRQVTFEADVALEYAQHGRPLEAYGPNDSLKRVRRNLREVLG